MDFKVLFQISVNKTDENVFFKPDGQRFEKAMTVKLNADTEYTLCFSIRPPLDLQNLLINGELFKFVEKKGAIEDEDFSKTYIAKYKTVPDDVNKNGKRKNVFFTLECENGVNMNFTIQCKVYKAGEINHAHWGQKLSTVNMDCKINKEQNCIKILNEKYF